jgi:exosome complex RNA-binding protein Rrp42 (RNase PH superfamily)
LYLQEQKPETAAVISVFAKKWRDDEKRWEEYRELEYESDSDSSE